MQDPSWHLLKVLIRACPAVLQHTPQKTVTAMKKSQAGKDRAVVSRRQTEPMPFAACFLEVLENVKDVTLLGKAFIGDTHPG